VNLALLRDRGVAMPVPRFDLKIPLGCAMLKPSCLALGLGELRAFAVNFARFPMAHRPKNT
jgi:hypothetical protein